MASHGISAVTSATENRHGPRHPNDAPGQHQDTQQGGKRGVLLHGTLVVSILQGRHIPGERLGLLENITRKNVVAKGISWVAGRIAPAKCYAVLNVGASLSRVHTTVIRSHNPAWNETFILDVASWAQQLTFVVKDRDLFGVDALGSASIPASQVASLGETMMDVWLDLETPVLKLRKKHMPKLHVLLRFVTAKDSISDIAVPKAYFPARDGCQLQLFHDAHNDHPGPQSDIRLSDGQMYHDGSTWDTMYADLFNAQHFIYITGWSVWHELHMVRNGSAPDSLSLGELLKAKANQGVRVLMLIWDDRTSVSLPVPLGTEGVMGVKDSETVKFFRGSKVECVAKHRQGTSEDMSVVQRTVLGFFYTHHQKAVMCDVLTSSALPGAGAPPNGRTQREVVAYVGGIDLAVGRYDTAHHPLFSTVDTVHVRDMYQNCIQGFNPAQGGPREPWHDLHSRLTGPAAWDVLRNFEQRWIKQAGFRAPGRHRRRKKLLNFSHVLDMLLPPMYDKDNLEPEVWQQEVTQVAGGQAGNYPPTSWTIQVLRSIDSHSAAGLPKSNAKAVKMGLVTSKGRSTEISIHRGYVQAIRRADRFIYIENQYFIGGAHEWLESDEKPDGGADNLVAVELAIKIAAKIKAREDFAAYIVLPMFPEGVPSSASVQEVLHWQASTFRMLYRIIGDAIALVSAADPAYSSHPTDFLQVFCLGTKEPALIGSSVARAPEGTPQHQAQLTHRHMIYVHSKGMVVDDEYLILGSANLNQRSLAGSRDTEIAIMAHQPAHMLQRNVHTDNGVDMAVLSPPPSTTPSVTGHYPGTPHRAASFAPTPPVSISQAAAEFTPQANAAAVIPTVLPSHGVAPTDAGTAGIDSAASTTMGPHARGPGHQNGLVVRDGKGGQMELDDDTVVEIGMQQVVLRRIAELNSNATEFLHGHMQGRPGESGDVTQSQLQTDASSPLSTPRGQMSNPDGGGGPAGGSVPPSPHAGAPPLSPRSPQSGMGTLPTSPITFTGPRSQTGVHSRMSSIGSSMDVRRELRLPKGQVHGFRMALWKEHLGVVRREFDDPSSRECRTLIWQLAAENWRAYADAEVPTLPHGHLLTYPYHIDELGNLSALEGSLNFPDTDAPVLGQRIKLLPDHLTT